MIRKAAHAPEFSPEPWQGAQVFHINHFPWETEFDRQNTTLRALYDPKALYLQYHCQDRHIVSKHVGTNSHVFMDSCVEFFASIEPHLSPDYFNLEMNACGHLLMGFGHKGGSRQHISEDLAGKIRIVSSVPGPKRNPSPDDSEWWLCAQVPWSVISELAGRQVRPTSGTVWHANAYRCGGDSDFAAWYPIDHPVPSFHRPEHFRKVTFE